MSLLLILWLFTSLDLCLCKKGSLSFPWQACRLLLVLFNSPKLHTFCFWHSVWIQTRCRWQTSPADSQREPTSVPSCLWISGDWSVSVARLTAPGLNLIFQTCQFEAERGKKKKVEVNELRRGTAKWRGRMEKVVAGLAENGGGLTPDMEQTPVTFKWLSHLNRFALFQNRWFVPNAFAYFPRVVFYSQCNNVKLGQSAHDFH